MATIITNRASVSYNYGTETATAVSNLATTVLQGAVAIEKTSLAGTYTPGDTLTYIIGVTNSGETWIDSLEITDDLGAYEGEEGTVVPLDYAGGALLYINGVPQGEITGTVGDGGVTFTVPQIPAGGNALIVYNAVVNGEAPAAQGGTITNTASAVYSGETVSASSTVTAEESAQLSIVKTMSPNPVVTGGLLTYDFDITNTGNMAAENVVLTDAFAPAPSNVTVAVNGTEVAPENYTYVAGVLTFPAGGAYALTVPAASFTPGTPRTPGRVKITVTGTLN